MTETTKRPEPKFAPGDQVTFDWTPDDQTPHTIWGREWREYEQVWSYKIQGGNWCNENGLRLAGEKLSMEGDSDESTF